MRRAAGTISIRISWRLLSPQRESSNSKQILGFWTPPPTMKLGPPREMRLGPPLPVMGISMLAPKCRSCGERHWGLCVERRLANPVPPHVTLQPLSAPVTLQTTTPAEAQQAAAPAEARWCPECERRRLQTLERVRRHRAKRRY